MIQKKTITVNPGDELYHYGVLGMKWGARHYRRKDGSLTRAGTRKKAYLEKVRDEELRVARVNRQNEERAIKDGYGVRIAKSRLRAWAAAEKALANMSIDNLSMSRKDIVEAGRAASRKAVGFSPRL